MRSILRARVVDLAASLTTLAALAVLAPFAGAAPIVFDPHVEYSAGPFPLFLVLADLNGDGHADIATTTPNTQTDPPALSVLLNSGDGTFGDWAPVLTGEIARSIAAGDVDSDGDQDLVVAPESGDFRAVLLRNDGHAQFASPEFLAPIPGRADGVRVLDLDGDNDQDIVLAQAFGDEVAVLENEGGGTFAPVVTYGGAFQAYIVHLAVGDVDGDLDPDLAVSRSLAQNVLSIYRNLGDGSFAAPQTVAGIPTSCAGGDLGDLDGDQDLDVVLASDQSGSVFAVRNAGTGLFTAWGWFPSGVEMQLGTRVKFADLDRDNRADAIVPGANTFRLASLRGAGDAGFEAGQTHALGWTARAVAAADLDGDLDLDLVATLPQVDQVSVLINQSEITAAVEADPRSTSFRSTSFSLGPVYPNPVRTGTSIPFDLSRRAQIQVSVVDLGSRHVRSLFDGERLAGRHVVSWDGRDERGNRVAAGIYMLQLTAGHSRQAGRIVVVP